jgi:integrase/recombinase XerD
MSDLRAAAGEYLALRRSLGARLVEAERMLNGFVGYLEARGASTVTIELALEWATLPRQATAWWWRQRLSAVRGFARYLQAFDPDAEVPPTGLIYSPVPRATPYVFKDDEIVGLLAAAAELQPALRGATYRAFLGLLAVTGMRVSEAIALDDEDVGTSEALIMVRHGKGGKERELLVHPSAAGVLGEYRQIRRCACPRPKTTAFFISTRGTRLHYSNVLLVFRQLLGELGLSAGGSQGRPPRIHDLRHRLAIISLLGWYRDGLDVQPRLPVLSTYLGHKNPADTFWYLSATPELLALAARRLENAWTVLP